MFCGFLQEHRNRCVKGTSRRRWKTRNLVYLIERLAQPRSSRSSIDMKHSTGNTAMLPVFSTWKCPSPSHESSRDLCANNYFNTPRSTFHICEVMVVDLVALRDEVGLPLETCL